MKLIWEFLKSGHIPVTMVKDFPATFTLGLFSWQSAGVACAAMVLFLKQSLCFRVFVFLTLAKPLMPALLCSAHVRKQISQRCFLSVLGLWEESKSL